MTRAPCHCHKCNEAYGPRLPMRGPVAATQAPADADARLVSSLETHAARGAGLTLDQRARRLFGVGSQPDWDDEATRCAR